MLRFQGTSLKVTRVLLGALVQRMYCEFFVCLFLKERLYCQMRSIMFDNKEKSVALSRAALLWSAAPTSSAAGRRLCPPGTPCPPSASAPLYKQALPLSRWAAGLSHTYCRARTSPFQTWECLKGLSVTQTFGTSCTGAACSSWFIS